LATPGGQPGRHDDPDDALAQAENRLIAMLCRADRKHLLALCEPATLVLAEVLRSPLRAVLQGPDTAWRGLAHWRRRLRR